METQGELERERTWDRNYVNVVHMQEILKNKLQTAATTKNIFYGPKRATQIMRAQRTVSV